jgi:hypothetical protein
MVFFFDAPGVMGLTACVLFLMFCPWQELMQRQQSVVMVNYVDALNAQLKQLSKVILCKEDGGGGGVA